MDVVEFTTELLSLIKTFTDEYHVKEITRTGIDKVLVELPSGDRFELKVTSV